MTDYARYSNPAPGGVDLSNLWGEGGEAEANLRRAFTWITRTGAGRKFGSVPIAWYQQHQVAAIDTLTDTAKRRGIERPRFFRLHQGEYQADDAAGHWVRLDLTPDSVFRTADSRLR